MAMLSIGEFARATELTPKALRLYDELGLLPPARVDPHSGYRYYRNAQLEQARLVALLRRLGMPLARIRMVCELPPPAAVAEVTSYWRQVEADTSARKELATSLIDQLSRKDTTMTDQNMKLDIRHAIRVDQGQVRDNNQDAAYAGARLLAVADGYGIQGNGVQGSGVQGSGVQTCGAGRVAIDALAPLDAQRPTGDLLNILSKAANDASSAVRDFTASDSEYVDAGTTLTAMLLSGSHLALLHIGDSRAYLLRAGELSRITHDHTFVQSLVDEGRLTQEEASSHPRRARLIRALTCGGTSEPDLHLREVRVGDRYLLCSDGLHAVITEQLIRTTLGETDSPRQAVDVLGDLVRDSGAPDNLACIVADVVSEENR